MSRSVNPVLLAGLAAITVLAAAPLIAQTKPAAKHA